MPPTMKAEVITEKITCGQSVCLLLLASSGYFYSSSYFFSYWLHLLFFSCFYYCFYWILLLLFPLLLLLDTSTPLPTPAHTSYFYSSSYSCPHLDSAPLLCRVECDAVVREVGLGYEGLVEEEEEQE